MVGVIAGREVRLLEPKSRSGVAYGAAWAIIDRILASGESGFRNATEMNGTWRTPQAVIEALNEIEDARPMGAVIELTDPRDGRVWIPRYEGKELSGAICGHAAILNDDPHDVQIVRFVTVTIPNKGLYHVRVSAREGENRRPTPDNLPEMVREAYLQTVTEFPFWQEVTLGLKGPNFMGITRVGEVGAGPTVPEEMKPQGLTSKMLADKFSSMYQR